MAIEQGRQLTEFERSVMEALLAGDHAVLQALRSQLDSCKVTSREETGHGFFTRIAVEGEGVRVAGLSARIRDVGAEIEGLEHGAGFVLVVVDGYLSCLEGFSYEEPWPRRIGRYVLRYENDRVREASNVDLPWVDG